MHHLPYPNHVDISRLCDSGRRPRGEWSVQNCRAEFCAWRNPQCDSPRVVGIFRGVTNSSVSSSQTNYPYDHRSIWNSMTLILLLFLLEEEISSWYTRIHIVRWPPLARMPESNRVLLPPDDDESFREHKHLDRWSVIDAVHESPAVWCAVAWQVSCCCCYSP